MFLQAKANHTNTQKITTCHLFGLCPHRGEYNSSVFPGPRTSRLEPNNWNFTSNGDTHLSNRVNPFFLEVQSGQFHFELLQSLQKMTLTSQNNHLTKTYLTGWLYFSWLESQGPILIASENPKKALRTMKLQCFISRQHWVSSWGDLIGYETYSDFPFSLDNI
jgi:hypothetical protein